MVKIYGKMQISKYIELIHVFKKVGSELPSELKIKVYLLTQGRNIPLEIVIVFKLMNLY